MEKYTYTTNQPMLHIEKLDVNSLIIFEKATKICFAYPITLTRNLLVENTRENTHEFDSIEIGHWNLAVKYFVYTIYMTTENYQLHLLQKNCMHGSVSKSGSVPESICALCKCSIKIEIFKIDTFGN